MPRLPRPPRVPAPPHGLLSLAALALFALLLPASIGMLTASAGYGLLTLALVGAPALVGAEYVLGDDPTGGGRR